MATHYEQGNYVARVIEQAFTEAKTGTPQIALKIRPTHHIRFLDMPEERLEEIDSAYDRTIYLAVTDKSMDMVLKKLRHAGFTGDRFEQLKLADCDVRCACKYEMYNGSENEKWDLLLPQSELKHDPAVTRKLNALFGKKLKDGATKAIEPTTPAMERKMERNEAARDAQAPLEEAAPPSEWAAAAVGEDEVPF